MAGNPAWAIPKVEEIIVKACEDGSITIEQYDGGTQETAVIQFFPEHVEMLKNFLDFASKAIDKGEHLTPPT